MQRREKHPATQIYVVSRACLQLGTCSCAFQQETSRLSNIMCKQGDKPTQSGSMSQGEENVTTKTKKLSISANQLLSTPTREKTQAGSALHLALTHITDSPPDEKKRG